IDGARLAAAIHRIHDHERLIAVHQLLHEADPPTPRLDDAHALRHPRRDESPHGDDAEAVVPAEVVAHPGDKHARLHAGATSSVPTAILISPSRTATGSTSSLPSPSSRLPVRMS